MDFILQYIDAIWLLVAFLVVHKDHRNIALFFVLGCMFMMRMQVEMMVSIDYPTGMLDFMSIHAFNRGVMVYTASYLIYLIFLHFTAKNDKSIVMASSIGMFFMVFLVSSVVMLL